MLKTVIFILICIYSPIGLAWNSICHEITAQIAYVNLNQRAKREVNRFNRFIPEYSQFIYAAIWPDVIKGHGIKNMNNWHYIDIPYKKSKKPNIDPHNVVSTIDNSLVVLKNRKSSDYEKAIFLRFLIHSVADIHQPLHAIDNNDHGGNTRKITWHDINNLHTLWDQGLRFYSDGEYVRRLPVKSIKAWARQLQQAYPRSYFSNINIINPMDWAYESYDIAKKSVYSINYDKTLDQTYINNGQSISQQRLVLAGYRLAALLNQLYPEIQKMNK